MRADVVTFAVPEDRRPDVIARLDAMGFAVDPARQRHSCLLDTFDGRLYAAGLRLAAETEGAVVQLMLSGTPTVRTAVFIPAMPRFASDLPVGPFRARLAAIIEVRALLPLMSMSFVHTAATLRDALDKTVVVADVFQLMQVDGRVVGEPAVTIEITEVTGYPKKAAAVVDTLDDVGLRRLATDTVASVAAATDVNLAGYSDVPTVPLDPQMPAVDGMRAVLANLAATVAANWQGTIDEVDPEFLHDLRVAVRRTRAVLSHGKKVLPAAVVVRAAERFARLGALTGRPRDLDVYLIEWDGYVKPLSAPVIAALAPARTVLDQRCRSAHADLVEGLRSNDAIELLTMWQDWLRDPSIEGPGPDGHRPLGQLVAKRILRAHSTLIERGRLIGPGSPSERIHDLRKDAKKVRYLLECFGSLLVDKPRKSFVRRLKALQDNLGEYQDTVVHADELADIATGLHAGAASAQTLLAIGQLIELLEQRHAAARAEFADRFAAYDAASTTRVLRAALAIERS